MIIVLLIITYFLIINCLFYDFLGSDGFFHWRYSSLIWDNPEYEFDSLPLTIYSDNFVDHHFLFHKILSYFAIFGDFWGSKIAVSFFMFVLMSTILFTYKKLNIRRAVFWTIITLFWYDIFTYRMMMLRVNALSVTFVIFFIYLLINKKYFIILILSTLYTMLYLGSIILLPITCLYIMVDSKKNIKANMFLLLGISISIIIGFIFHNDFPSNVKFLYEYIVSRIELDNPTLFMNNEWKRIGLFDFIILLCPFIVTTVYLGSLINTKHFFLDKNIKFFFLLSTLLMLMSFMYIRAYEYFVPVAVLFMSYTFNEAENKGYLNDKIKHIMTILIIVCVINHAFFLKNTIFSQKLMNKQYSSSIKWFKENTKDEDLIFNIPYSTFTRLYFYKPFCHYVTGLEPDFLRRERKDIFVDLLKLYSGKSIEIRWKNKLPSSFKYVYLYLSWFSVKWKVGPLELATK